jgi:hypothetical protein
MSDKIPMHHLMYTQEQPATPTALLVEWITSLPLRCTNESQWITFCGVDHFIAFAMYQ